MYIAEKIRTDRMGRIVIKKLFLELPEAVVVTFDTDTKELVFTMAEEGQNPSFKRRVDSKGRVSLPRWMIDELGELYILTIDSAERHSVLPEKLFETV